MIEANKQRLSIETRTVMTLGDLRGKPRATFDESRTCLVCDKALSRYNRGPNCWLHASPTRFNGSRRFG